MHGIYKGVIIEYIMISEKVVCFNVDGDECSIGIDHITIIPEEEYKKVEAELQTAKNEVLTIRERMLRLDESYKSKNEALRELYLQARQKEQSIVSKVLDALKNNLIDSKGDFGV